MVDRIKDPTISENILIFEKENLARRYILAILKANPQWTTLTKLPEQPPEVELMIQEIIDVGGKGVIYLSYIVDGFDQTPSIWKYDAIIH